MIITPPGFENGEYKNNSECEWIIIPRSDTKLMFLITILYIIDFIVILRHSLGRPFVQGNAPPAWKLMVVCILDIALVWK